MIKNNSRLNEEQINELHNYAFEIGIGIPSKYFEVFIEKLYKEYDKGSYGDERDVYNCGKISLERVAKIYKNGGSKEDL